MRLKSRSAYTYFLHKMPNLMSVRQLIKLFKEITVRTTPE